MVRTTAGAAKGGQPADREELWEQMKESDEWVVGALLRLYDLQEEDEKASHSTNKLNTVGFNAFDARDMTSIAQFYLRTKFLTKPQIKYVRRTMAKYCGQLIRVGVTPLPIKYKTTKKEEVDDLTWAGMAGNGKEVLIKFRFPKGDKRFQETLDLVRTIPGRR